MPLLQATDQHLNVKKTCSLGINTPAFVLKFRRNGLPSKEVSKILGLKCRFANGKVKFQYYPEDLESIEPTCSRIGGAGLDFWTRSLVIGGALISKINYAADCRQLNSTQERGIRATLTATLSSSSTATRKRTPGILMTLFAKGHVGDVTQASLTSRWVRYARAIRNDPNLAELVWSSKIRDPSRVHGRGPCEALSHSCERLRFEWNGATNMIINGNDYNLLDCNTDKFQHDLRDHNDLMQDALKFSHPMCLPSLQ